MNLYSLTVQFRIVYQGAWQVCNGFIGASYSTRVRTEDLTVRARIKVLFNFVQSPWFSRANFIQCYYTELLKAASYHCPHITPIKCHHSTDCLSLRDGSVYYYNFFEIAGHCQTSSYLSRPCDPICHI